MNLFTENVPFWGCNIFCCLELFHSTQFYQQWFKCKKILVFDEIYFPFGNCCYDFFISIATVVKETNFFNTPIPQCLLLPDLAEWWVTLTGCYPQSCSTLWFRGLTKSHDKYLWGVPSHKVTWSFDHVVWWSHTTNYIFYICTCTWPIATYMAKWYITIRGFPPESDISL